MCLMFQYVFLWHFFPHKSRPSFYPLTHPLPPPILPFHTTLHIILKTSIPSHLTCLPFLCFFLSTSYTFFLPPFLPTSSSPSISSFILLSLTAFPLCPPSSTFSHFLGGLIFSFLGLVDSNTPSKRLWKNSSVLNCSLCCPSPSCLSLCL